MRQHLGKSCWQGLLACAKTLGRVQTWLVLTLFYFLLLAPVALIFRCVADPLGLRRRGSPWRPKQEPPDRWAWAKAQS